MTFFIMGVYKGKTKEIIDEAPDRETAEFLLKEYRLAYGSDWYLYLNF